MNYEFPIIEKLDDVLPHMCANEVVRTAYKAVEAAIKHELDEHFTFKGTAIFHPHMNYDLVAALGDHPDFLETRSNGMSGV